MKVKKKENQPENDKKLIPEASLKNLMKNLTPRVV